LIFAASFASSLLGSQALGDGVGVWDWIARGLLFAIGALAVLLWPYYNLTFRFDPEDLLVRYVDVADPMPMSAIDRELALQIKSDWEQNGRRVRRQREALQLALILLLLEIVVHVSQVLRTAARVVPLAAGYVLICVGRVGDPTFDQATFGG
jgi:hypothetical protein